MAPHVDPVIPSWSDYSVLVGFFQRQLIHLHAATPIPTAKNMEAVKNIGTAVANVCQEFARAVKEFKSTIVVAATDDQNNVRLGQSPNGQAYIAWTGRGQHTIPADSQSLSNLRALYTGPPDLFLTSAFALLQRYATYRSLNPLEVRLPGPALA